MTGPGPSGEGIGRVVIAGVSGSLGRLLADRLAADGHYDRDLVGRR